jgi:hypothetical protein
MRRNPPPAPIRVPIVPTTKPSSAKPIVFTRPSRDSGRA